MKCIKCDFGDTRVIESRSSGDGSSTRRRRECPECKERFTTYERIEMPQLVVVKSSGTREIFSREKLMSGLLRACEKTAVTALQIENLVAEVEKELIDLGDTEVASNNLGQMVIEKLADINEVAYVRFASVYRRFDTLASFEKELELIRSRKNK
ncbi:MAG: transcriptional regulator NrdR [Patescibacteria group bacterium]